MLGWCFSYVSGAYKKNDHKIFMFGHWEGFHMGFAGFTVSQAV
jgi:hypothetical protein